MAQIMENDMKRYTIGLITGILLTASAFMFMGATTNQNHTHDATEIEYSSLVFKSAENLYILLPSKKYTLSCESLTK